MFVEILKQAGQRMTKYTDERGFGMLECVFNFINSSKKLQSLLGILRDKYTFRVASTYHITPFCSLLRLSKDVLVRVEFNYIKNQT